jgi:uncharacterized damage-inducible protein DinB
MQALEVFQTLFEYNKKLYERVWQSVFELSDDQFIEEYDYSHGSLRNQLVHISVVDKRWLMGLKGNPEARKYLLEPSDYPGIDATHKLWLNVNQEVTEFLQELSEERLENTPPGMGGPTWHILAQMINHGTDHRAQILSRLYDFQASTFDQDLILHLWVD